MAQPTEFPLISSLTARLSFPRPLKNFENWKPLCFITISCIKIGLAFKWNAWVWLSNQIFKNEFSFYIAMTAKSNSHLIKWFLLFAGKLDVKCQWFTEGRQTTSFDVCPTWTRIKTAIEWPPTLWIHSLSVFLLLFKRKIHLKNSLKLLFTSPKGVSKLESPFFKHCFTKLIHF